MMKRFLIIMAILMVTASCSPSNKHVCVPSGSSTSGGAGTDADTTTDAEGNEISKLEAIEKFLKEEKIISTIVKELKTKLIGDENNFGTSEQIFTGIVSNPQFQGAVGAAFTLFVIIYGVAILGGMVQANLGEAAIRIAKVGFISTIALNWGEFYEVVASTFINGMDELITFFLDAFGKLYQNNTAPKANEDIIFGDLDIFVSRVFSPHSVALVAALTNTTSGNIPLAGLLGFSMFFVMQGVLRILVVYVYALFALCLLFALAPVFFTFMLFQSTKPMFDSWLNMVINYSFQPVMVCAFMGLYIGLLAPFFQDLLQYKLCYGPTGNASSTAGMAWCFVNPTDEANQCIPFAASSQPPISWQSAFLFFVFSWLFGANVQFAATLAAALSPSFGSDLTKTDAMRHLTSSNPDKAGGILNMLKGGAKGT